MTATTNASSSFPAGPGAADVPAMTPQQTRIVILALIGTLLLAILDTNIVTAAATSISGSLEGSRGVSQVPWLVTAYARGA